LILGGLKKGRALHLWRIREIGADCNIQKLSYSGREGKRLWSRKVQKKGRTISYVYKEEQIIRKGGKKINIKE